jgi:hypothetical protein
VEDPHQSLELGEIMTRFVLVVTTMALCGLATASTAVGASFHASGEAALHGVGPGTIEPESFIPSKVTTKDGSISCGEDVFGGAIGTKFVTLWTKDTSQLNIVPVYTKCKYGEHAVTFHATGCRLSFTIEAEPEPSKWTGKFGITSAGESECIGSEIWVERSGCRWSFPVQETHATVEYAKSKYPSQKVAEEKEGGIQHSAVEATMTVTGLKYTLAGLLCFSGSYADGSWHEHITLYAQSTSSGKTIDFTIE